ncbi:hypothetical protein [Lactobacillus sp. LL6]|uniref:hypothetical protein n=1 Tax=Lactobacillus sp. LL6 TaxID=2596827 RepID=UPI001186B1DA|nr:hypothetical protein [Lactobacillus sp. LL6]TSO25726.1 hypothetical protein FOD82_01210 [Lactobacillus sp. LL6]
MKRKFKLFTELFLGLILILILSACSTSKSKTSALPKAQTILSTAQNTNLNSLQATWAQTNSNKQTEQKALVKYTKKPLIMYVDFSTPSNRYKMWINNKTNYIQMHGTATNKWFKTKLTDASSYSQLADSIAKNALLNFDDSTAKLFKVKKTTSGYSLTYKGSNKEIWNIIKQNSSLTSTIGVDFSSAKPINSTITINTDKNYKLTNLAVSAKYKIQNKIKTLSMNVDKINKLGKLKVPSSITKNAVNLEKTK